MLHFSNGVERLVIETSFVGQGTNFAWVVPLPSVPKIEAVSTNFFRNLNTTFQPKLIFKASAAWVLYLFLGSLVTATIWAFRKRGAERLKSVVVCLILLVLTGLLVLPNFVQSRGTSSVSQALDSVNVLNQQRVGIYDTATVSGRDGRALLDWLNTHGFHTPASALPVISNYVRQGWVFAVANVHRASSSQLRSDLHPLAFTFHTEKPVYPLSLTGVENDHCQIELFVFGSGRAKAVGFKVEYCGQPFEVRQIQASGYDLAKEIAHFQLPAPGEHRLSDPEVRAFAMPATVTTKLIGNLTASDMRSDAWIRWVPFQPEVPVLYGQAAAITAFLDCTVGISVIGLLTLHILTPRLSRRACERGLMAVLLLAATYGLIRLGTAKVTEVRITRGGWRAVIANFQQLDGVIEQHLLERKTTEPLTFESLFAATKDYFRDGAKNPFTGEPIKNEASPGNLTLRNCTNGVEVIWYDISGGAQPLATFPTRSK